MQVYNKGMLQGIIKKKPPKNPPKICRYKGLVL